MAKLRSSSAMLPSCHFQNCDNVQLVLLCCFLGTLLEPLAEVRREVPEGQGSSPRAVTCPNCQMCSPQKPKGVGSRPCVRLVAHHSKRRLQTNPHTRSFPSAVKPFQWQVCQIVGKRAHLQAASSAWSQQSRQAKGTSCGDSDREARAKDQSKGKGQSAD